MKRNLPTSAGVGRTTPPTFSTARTAGDFLFSAETNWENETVYTSRVNRIRSKRLITMINLSQPEHTLGNPKALLTWPSSKGD